jgi:hypothetical protein
LEEALREDKERKDHNNLLKRHQLFFKKTPIAKS